MTEEVETQEAQAPAASSPTALHASYLEDIAYLIGTQQIVRAVHLMNMFRQNLKAHSLSAFLTIALVPGSETHSKLSSYLPKEDEHDIDVDTASSAPQGSALHFLPEIEIYCYLLVLIFLIGQKRYNEAKACSSTGIARLKSIDRTVDLLSSRLYFYYSYSHELTNSLAEIRGNLFALHRMATLRHDQLGQETLLNLLLRNYLHYNLYDQAEKLRSKAPRFESLSIHQFCRYSFYLGKIKTIRLEYTDAKESLLQAARKAPISAHGFRIQCNKWAIIVCLLLATKLRLVSENPVADTESIIAKTIRDGVIDATIDHANGWMLSKETGDIYSTNEPQIAFHSRIAFCLNMHSEAVKALRFPRNPGKEKEIAEKRSKRKRLERLLAIIAEEESS